jgi:uncharacterized protein YbjT (DUF2867 family)
MKIMVIGGTGLVGKQVVTLLRNDGHQAFAASPSTGVNTITGDGLEAAMNGSDVVVDVSNAPSFDEASVTTFFRTSTSNILAAERSVGVKHHVAVSIVGVGSSRLPSVGYMAGKLVQEELIRNGGVPFTIIKATQFFEFLVGIADQGTSAKDGKVHLSPHALQPIATRDLARFVASCAVAEPLNGERDLAGPDRAPIHHFVRKVLEARNDPREIVVEPDAGYYGIPIVENSLVPTGEAEIGKTTLDEWLAGGASR